ncbi:MAG: aminotransferase class IV [Bryobacteraceae bacterium]
MHRFILHNDEIREASEAVFSAGQTGLLSGWGVFSTLRVIEGVPFAFEKHWARMQGDARALRVPFPSDPDAIRSRLLELVERNAAFDAVMRIAVVRNRGGLWQGPETGRDYDIVAMTTAQPVHHRGVQLALRANARHAAGPFHGTKMLAWAVNAALFEGVQIEGFDEAILLNERGEVAECTSANVFAACGNRVRTPPLESGCLPGVTREILLHEIAAEGFAVEEKTLYPGDLDAADEVFITSTTRALLPVLEIEGKSMAQRGDARRALQREFDLYTGRYVALHKGTRSTDRLTLS